MAKALGMDKSTIAKYELSEPGRTCSQRHIPYQYIEAFAGYMSLVLGETITDVDVIARASAAYDAEQAEQRAAALEEQRLASVAAQHGRR